MKHTPLSIITLVALVFSAYPQHALAAVDDIVLLVRPHCEEENPEDCETYEITNPELMSTKAMKGGDILDFDIIIENPTSMPIHRVRSWIAYDPNFLTGMDIEPNTLFPLVTPGETDFNAENGYVQLELTAEEGLEPTGTVVIVARVRMKLTQSPQSDTAISFYDVQEGGHTEITRLDGGQETSILLSEPGTLLVLTEKGTDEEDDDLLAFEEVENTDTSSSSQSSVQSSAQSSSSSSEVSKLANGETCQQSNECQSNTCVSGICSEQTAQGSSSSQTSSEQKSAFILLQIQQLRITTEGSTVYLSWNPLQSSSLKGYNIYYGSISGQYLQRRSIGPELANITLRNLPTGTTYYFAVRAVNMDDEESAFSQEVGITVGDPTSSTSPLIGSVGGNPIDAGAGVVPGETGASSVLVFLLVLSAIIGTSFAWKRQLAVHPTSQR